MKLPGIYTYSKALVADVLEQIIYYYPERRQEALDWYIEILTFYSQTSLEENIMDSEVVAFIISHLMDLQGKSAMPIITELFEKGYVTFGICGDFDEVKNCIENEKLDFSRKRELLTITDRYQKVISTWFGYIEDDEYDEDDDLDFSELTPRYEPINSAKKNR